MRRSGQRSYFGLSKKSKAQLGWEFHQIVSERDEYFIFIISEILQSLRAGRDDELITDGERD